MNREEVELIDEKLRSKAEEEKTEAPEYITQFMVDTIEKLPEKRKVRGGAKFLLRFHITAWLEIASVVFVLILIPYIIMQMKEPISNRAAGNLSTQNILADLKVDDIQWMTLGGGRPSDEVSSPLFLGRDEKQLSKILAILKNGNNFRKTDNSERPLGMKGGGPTGLYIKLKNGSKYYLIPAYKREEIIEDGLTGMRLTPLTDRFIITNTENNESYTVFSEEAAEYMVQDLRKDFPYVKAYSIEPENFKVGDKVSIKGKGSIEDEVDICLVTEDSEAKEEYVIAKVTPTYGEWKWEGELSRELKTFDGQTIPFSDRIMYLSIHYGDRGVHPGNALDFSKTATNSTTSGKGTDDFYFYLNYRIDANYEFFNNTITKYIKGQSPVTSTLKLTEDEVETIYKEMKAIDIFSYPDHIGQINFDNDTDYNYYQIKVTIDGVVKNLYLQDKDGAQDEKTVKLRKLFLNIHEIISAKEEFKKLP